MEVEGDCSAVTGSHPPAATAGLLCRGFSGLACPGPPGPAIGEKLWAVDDSASGGLVTFCSSRLPAPIPAIQFNLPIKSGQFFIQISHNSL